MRYYTRIHLGYHKIKVWKELRLFCIIFCFPGFLQAQGIIPKAKDGSFKGALALTSQSSLTKGLPTAVSPYPGKTDPMLERNSWMYSDDKLTAVRGFVKDAVLIFQWWTLLGDPIEKYEFKWVTSGYYEVTYEEEGREVTKSIYRDQLLKYPDLLKKFDHIEPVNVDVEISLSSGNIDDQDYFDFRKKYNILSSLGSAGYKSSYTVIAKGDAYLYGASGQNSNFILPAMALGGWPDFLNIEKKIKKLSDVISNSFVWVVT